MRDRVPGAPGQYKAVITAAELLKLQSGEQFTITLIRDDQPITEGTPYSKAAVLPDELARQICPGIEDPTPADALRQLSSAVGDKASADHIHNYAGSTVSGGAANSANKLNTDAGSGNQPVYFSDGIPKPTTYTLGKSVPSNAVFTDTTALGSMTGILTLAKGGTGSSNGATGLKNLFAAGNTILSSYQYGTALPAAGTVGRVFFKKVSG